MRGVLGRIDLAPASCVAANERVRASTFFTIDDDGLSKSWWGHVFMNPPYGRAESHRSNQDIWTQKLIDEFDAKRVVAAIALVNAVPGQAWFQRLWRFPICLVGKRIAFISAVGVAQKSPTHSNALVYLGPHVERFRRVMSALGRVVLPEDPSCSSTRKRITIPVHPSFRAKWRAAELARR